ncbi:pseudaminic acid cytidylyltransferase [Noviherbaspirillum galbum]|uniref:Pseudaminic acid cytidylyltransferase n=1 Tax=Noviherbaspirillum galbum TaxID=2709383 RepID=A0A6B3SGD2_9BURK|nr:pseudaminic acid cytidylyltransferase [Noviherbaspirillum galbum]NEX59663.1 pseudaminic acid cytidylyltransferase [Noviherbaspirillum galbum]
MRIAVIPARGGSKRIPRKNIKEFAGKPMIAYAIGAAFECGLFEHVVVTTDDDEIAGIARGLGAEVPFKRPAELSDDHAGTVPVIAHAIDACASLGWDVRVACCIYPGVPLIQVDDLRDTCKMLEEGGADYAFTVTSFPAAIQRALKRGADGRMAPFYPEFVRTRTQDLEPGYYDAGQFYWGTVDAWRSGRSPHQAGKGLVIPEWRAVDIDTPDDWARAEVLYRMINRRDAG